MLEAVPVEEGSAPGDARRAGEVVEEVGFGVVAVVEEKTEDVESVGTALEDLCRR